MQQNLKPLFIFEMANNHNGNVDRGVKIIEEIAEVVKDYKKKFDFAFKFQYRNLETFIHPNYKDRLDLKFVKRFSDTKLSNDEFLYLQSTAKKYGFLTICTGFDELSVELIYKQKYDFIKIASCSFNDWPLLEKIATVDMPIIASTAGASVGDIEKVVQFFLHRDKHISLMHCVAEYPTSPQHMQLNQIDLLKSMFPKLTVGFSTHEKPENMDTVKMAIAKGARIFEKHVGLADYEGSINSYSATPDQIKLWLEFASEAFDVCGDENGRYNFSESEINSLKNLSRAVFAKKTIKKGELIDNLDTFLAIPSCGGQLFASDLSKYKDYVAKESIEANEPIMVDCLNVIDNRPTVESIINRVKDILKEARIVLPNKVSLEISHHYGLEHFDEVGAVIINCINREYCKKLLVMMPNQRHPMHMHKIKEESFQILYGNLQLTIDGENKSCSPGDIELVKRGVMHGFSTTTGVVFEEISTEHIVGDSYYEDNTITENKKRKTNFTYWLDD